ncbi:hypothetical protein F4778DRAFT_790008 [Xylariomycetidae sp. FL2044]|nr:hypothetical protein F4778DRAFT_790008 [Xylariomycetidae sp. FL2044]
MTILQTLIISIGLGSAAVQAAVINPSSSSDIHITPREDGFAAWMKSKSFPENSKVCNMIKNTEKDTWKNSKAGEYLTQWLKDNGNKLDDWPQQIHKNATKDGTTPGKIDCTELQSENCLAMGDGDCENYNPAAFGAIQTSIVNLYSVFQALDVRNVKETLLNNLKMSELVNDFINQSELDKQKKELSIAAVSMWLISGCFGVLGLGGAAGWTLGSGALVGGLTKLGATSGVGGFAFNTFGGTLSLMGTTLTDGVLDPGKVEDELNKKLGEYFDQLSDHLAALTAKIFGGKPKDDVSLKDFVKRVEKEADVDNDQEVLNYMFKDDHFMTQQKAGDLVKPTFDAGFKVMKAGLIGYLFGLRGLYVMHYTDIDEDKCKKDFDDAGRWVDNDCFVLKIGGTPGNRQCVESDDNAPTELKRMGDKYGIVVDNFFRNVRDCDNRAGGNSYRASDLDHIGTCFYQTSYLRCNKPDELWNIHNDDVASGLNLIYRTQKGTKQGSPCH